MDALKSLHLGLRFLLEVGALIAVGYWGWKSAEGTARWALAIGAVIAVIVVWTLFVSPNPTIELSMPIRLIIEFAVWVAAALALYATGNRALGIAFFLIAVLSSIANYLWR
jgi:hypothetical protein